LRINQTLRLVSPSKFAVVTCTCEDVFLFIPSAPRITKSQGTESRCESFTMSPTFISCAFFV